MKLSNRIRDGILHLTWCQPGACSRIVGSIVRHCSRALSVRTADGPVLTVSAVQYGDGAPVGVHLDTGEVMLVLSKGEAEALAVALTSVTRPGVD